VADDSASLELACPRCGELVRERFYGPCRRCRDELAASLARPAHAAERVEYVPRANVVANHVATKD
jgi:hypothetical protein